MILLRYSRNTYGVRTISILHEGEIYVVITKSHAFVAHNFLDNEKKIERYREFYNFIQSVFRFDT